MTSEICGVKDAQLQEDKSAPKARKMKKRFLHPLPVRLFPACCPFEPILLWCFSLFPFVRVDTTLGHTSRLWEAVRPIPSPLEGVRPRSSPLTPSDYRRMVPIHWSPYMITFASLSLPLPHSIVRCRRCFSMHGMRSLEVAQPPGWGGRRALNLTF